jgi:predicted O-linked N-acetylglucosamine transferase (SPINDLY family)
MKQWEAALESFDRALAVMPDDALAHFNRAGVLRELARHVEALASYERAIAIKPDYFEAYCNYGFLLIEQQRWDEALEAHTKSIEINACFAPTHVGRGVALQERKEWAASLASYDRAIELDPGIAEAHFHRGVVLMEMRQWSAARASLECAVRLKPDFADAYYSLAALWTAVGRFEVALENFDRAIALNPGNAQAYISRGTLLVDMKRFLPAIESFDRGVALHGDSSFVPGARCFAKMSICDWSEFSVQVDRLAAGVEAGEKVLPPQQALALLDSASLLYKVSQIWVQNTHPPQRGLARMSPRRPDRIRIGYFSGEFYPHPVAYLIAGVLESHDRSRFEVIAFSYGAHSQDEFGKRLERGVDRFVDVREKSDRDVALLAREMEIDIAVDLAGHTGRSRTGIFAWRAAPLQVNYLGYAGTMAADYMDYLVADGTVIPEGQESYYSEKIVRLPNSFLPYDFRRGISGTTNSRSKLGLPARGFVYCCFNNSYKITPGRFASWMRVLVRVPTSVLWLSRSNETAVENLRREASRHGVDPGRLIFADHMPSAAEHLARQRVADLFLDTGPFNAHSTALDALCVGLPILTLPGSGFAARVAASLLTSLQLPELIATSAAEYETTAIRMAEDAHFCAAIREKLAQRLLDSPIFDTARYTRYLEIGYLCMADQLCAGLPSEHIHVPA